MVDPLELGKYVIEKRLGQGAMGTVYRGFDPAIGRAVALKTIRKDHLDPEGAEEMLVRFKREAQAAGRLNHHNIVTVYEYGEDKDTVFIAMELVEGRDLKDILSRHERVSIGATLNIMTQLLEALAYSHQQGVVHRDVKPANIILLADGTIKITDFGIAHLETSNLTQHGAVLGTPSYMSPEQCMGDVVDSRTDIFSAGVIMYQLLTAEKPFPGEAMTTIMHRVVNVEPLAPSQLNLKIPSALEHCVVKALAKNPMERYQSADEFLTAVKAVDPGQFAAPAMIRVAEDQTVADPEQDTVPIGQKMMPLKIGYVKGHSVARRRRRAGIFEMLKNKGTAVGIGAAALAALAFTVMLLVKGPEHSVVPTVEASAATAADTQQESAAKQPEAEPGSLEILEGPAKQAQMAPPPAKQKKVRIHLTATPSQGREAAPSSTPVRGIRPKVRD